MLGVIRMLRNLTAPYIRLYIADQWARNAANSEHADILKASEGHDLAAMKIMIRRHLWHTCEGIVTDLKKANGIDSGSQEEAQTGERPNIVWPESRRAAGASVKRPPSH